MAGAPAPGIPPLRRAITSRQNNIPPTTQVRSFGGGVALAGNVWVADGSEMGWIRISIKPKESETAEETSAFAWQTDGWHPGRCVR